ncbi:carbon monoxide dehydrogenase subunit G [Pseudoroseomonas cervicalis]|uniref:Carbon monoxide dehydrogenase subunit G (CoxG) n=1 Tax=Pseudoroseomonas cervicalis ATCC 49957 TaxID=525371 RepID=D5RFZ6_9PROT|nr:carbon monoxide dehydrogenase subunit G [Pseudoroseomonas cervicalis]EFH13774.1 carbon monoxide dehydrogenase subunit G (CoxG) [Pseudoroseomonas cervicalis ATCC 49957]
MEMTGERRIEAPRQTVWEGLNDPEILRASIPGCESVERTGEDSFQARVALKIGPMAAKFAGKVQLSNINPPASYTISGEGNGGAMGFAKGGADVALEEEGPQATLLRYAVKAQVGGKMAQLGARLIDSTAKQMADQFFDRFAAAVVQQPVAAANAEERLAAATLAAPRMGQPVLGPTGPLHPDAEKIDARPAPRPAAPAAQPISIFALMPSELFGLPLLFWGGSAVFLVVLILLFVIG